MKKYLGIFLTTLLIQIKIIELQYLASSDDLESKYGEVIHVSVVRSHFLHFCTNIWSPTLSVTCQSYRPDAGIMFGTEVFLMEIPLNAEVTVNQWL